MDNSRNYELLTCILNRDTRRSIFPPTYELPRHERPTGLDAPIRREIPVIHITVTPNDLFNRVRTVEEVMYACEHFGMFQVVNHKLSEDVMNNALRSSAMYFDQPSSNYLNAFANEMCQLYSGSAAKAFGLERESYWGNTLTMTYNTGFPARGWPTQPPYLR